MNFMTPQSHWPLLSLLDKFLNVLPSIFLPSPLLLSQYVTGEIQLQKMYKLLYLRQSVQAEIWKCTVGDNLCCPILPYTDKVVLPLTVTEAKSRPYHFSHADECNVYWKPVSIIHFLVYLSSELLSHSLLFSLCS